MIQAVILKQSLKNIAVNNLLIELKYKEQLGILGYKGWSFFSTEALRSTLIPMTLL